MQNLPVLIRVQLFWLEETTCSPSMTTGSCTTAMATSSSTRIASGPSRRHRFLSFISATCTNLWQLKDKIFRICKFSNEFPNKFQQELYVTFSVFTTLLTQVWNISVPFIKFFLHSAILPRQLIHSTTLYRCIQTCVL